MTINAVGFKEIDWAQFLISMTLYQLLVITYVKMYLQLIVRSHSIPLPLQAACRPTVRRQVVNICLSVTRAITNIPPYEKQLFPDRLQRKICAEIHSLKVLFIKYYIITDYEDGLC